MVSAKYFLGLQAGFALASPVRVPPASLLTVREAGVYNSSLPNITIFATGGTIAGSASSSDQTTGYQAGALGIETLINAVPQMWNVSNPSGIQVANVGSEAITPAILLNMTKQIQAELDSPECQGVVVTHGTDTLEETAFFLDLTLRTEKPVVVVGAMRPATAIAADGPMNLLEAVTLAASPSAKGRGAMIVLNDRIGSAYYTTKTNANSLDTFKAMEQGYLGFFIDIKPIFYFAPVLPVGKPYFDVLNTTVLPQVDILYGHQGLNPALATAAVETGAKGLVLAGMGAGGWTDEGSDVITDLIANNGTAVVDSRRTMDGYVEPTGTEGYYGGGFLNPQKARIMLQLALSAGYSDAQLRTVFEFDS
jgi:L-asparaginase